MLCCAGIGSDRSIEAAWKRICEMIALRTGQLIQANKEYFVAGCTNKEVDRPPIWDLVEPLVKVVGLSAIRGVDLIIVYFRPKATHIQSSGQDRSLFTMTLNRDRYTE